MEEYILEVNNLCKKYGNTIILQQVSLSVPAGSIYGIIGENGAGKTTLFRILAGLSRQTSGSIVLANANTEAEIRKTYGNRRSQILLVKCCRYILGCTMIIISYMTVSMLISFLTLETESTFYHLFMYTVKSILLSLPLFWVISVIFFFFAIITRKSAMAMGISVACSIIGVVFTNKFYFSMQQSDNCLLRFSPVIQIPLIYEQTFSACDYKSAIILSIFIAIIVLVVSSVIFNKAELP